MHAHLLAAAQNYEGIVQLPQVDILATDAAHALLLEKLFDNSPRQALLYCPAGLRRLASTNYHLPRSRLLRSTYSISL